jgi:hypothetical protein
MARREQFNVTNLTFTKLLDPSGMILFDSGVTVPTDGDAGYAKGCTFVDTDVGAGSQGVYINVGTTAACNFDVIGTIAALSVATGDIQANAVTSAKLTETTIQYAEVAISSAAITGTAAGQLGHADGVVLVADPGATKVVEFVSAVLIYDYAGAGYATGGDITVNSNGGAALSGIVSAANSLGSTSDKLVRFSPLSTIGVAMTANKGLNLVAASAFTNGGSATGVVRVKVAYRVHTHGL